jgi:hypothetical protein
MAVLRGKSYKLKVESYKLKVISFGSEQLKLLNVFTHLIPPSREEVSLLEEGLREVIMLS